MAILKDDVRKGTKLFIMLGVALLLIGLVIFSNIISFKNIEEVYMDQVIKSQIIETEHVSNQIENHILRVKDKLVTLSKFPIMETLNVNSCSGYMKIVHEDLEGLTDSLLRTDSDGMVIECSNSQFDDYVGINIQNKDYFRIPKESNEPYISDVIQQGSSRHIVISVPLYETNQYTPYPNYKGTFKGILFSVVDLENLFNLYLHPVIDNNHLFILINPQNNKTILGNEELLNYDVLINDLHNKPKNNVLKKLTNYGPTIITFSDIQLGDESWRLIVLTPLDTIKQDFSSVQRRHLFSLIFVLAVLLIALVGYIYLYKSKERAEYELKKTALTLEKLGIDIKTEEQKYAQTDIDLKPKNIYFIRDDSEGQKYELFVSCLNKGLAGLGITRENPELIKKRYGLKNTSFIWLSNNKLTNLPTETGIKNISKLVIEFIQKSTSSVILIDRLDYLYGINDSESVNRMIYDMKDTISSQNAIIILAANPALLKNKDLKVLDVETIDLFGSYLKKSINLTDQESEMLSFINGKNIDNKLVSYKDITTHFSITKPTTRAKISRLKKANLLVIEQRGRYKSIKITSAGRRLIS